jgi:hypothetical protein
MGESKEIAYEKVDLELVILLQVSTNRYLKKLPDMVHSKRPKHVFREGHMPRRGMEHKIRADKAVTGV